MSGFEAWKTLTIRIEERTASRNEAASPSVLETRELALLETLAESTKLKSGERKRSASVTSGRGEETYIVVVKGRMQKSTPAMRGAVEKETVTVREETKSASVSAATGTEPQRSSALTSTDETSGRPEDEAELLSDTHLNHPDVAREPRRDLSWADCFEVGLVLREDGGEVGTTDPSDDA